MTATPIPRTLALTIYGDLDVSLIDELPKGRKKVITRIIPPEKRKEAYGFIRKEVKKGKQIFVICPRIEPSKKSRDEILTENNFRDKASDLYEVKAVKNEYEKLSKEVFPDLKVAMLHGKMKTEEKEKTMKGFKKGTVDILVSTSVVEVGIDIPNASVMMIEGSEKFGLSQLHQFRGRVGRGGDQAYCLLFTEIPGGIYFRRLRALLSTDNGFELAEKDLEIRGPGEIFGIRQWGIPDLAMASLKDISLVEETRNAAKELLEKDPELKKHPLLAEQLKEFKERVHLE
jgi:ATP-dependent DNA helicase RecG